MLLFGSALVSIFFIPYQSVDGDDPILGLMTFSLIIGVVLLVLGAFIFFRRWVWRRQEKRDPVITTLRLK